MIPFLAVKQQAVRLRVKPQFPALVTAAPPILLDKSDGNFHFSLDQNALAIPPYAEGNWTPSLSFATPGNLAVTYNTGFTAGKWTRVGRQVFASFIVNTTAFTYTTAAGNLLIKGLPFTPLASDPNYRSYAPLGFQGIVKANYTSFAAAAVGGSPDLVVVGSGQGQLFFVITAVEVPSGGFPAFAGVLNYIV